VTRRQHIDQRALPDYELRAGERYMHFGARATPKAG
jgi:hypothetical protein